MYFSNVCMNRIYSIPVLLGPEPSQHYDMTSAQKPGNDIITSNCSGQRTSRVLTPLQVLCRNSAETCTQMFTLTYSLFLLCATFSPADKESTSPFRASLLELLLKSTLSLPLLKSQQNCTKKITYFESNSTRKQTV